MSPFLLSLPLPPSLPSPLIWLGCFAAVAVAVAAAAADVIEMFLPPSPLIGFVCFVAAAAMELQLFWVALSMA